MKNIIKKIHNKINKKIKKVPVFIQLEALECGATCLAMILAYYKKYVSTDQLRIDCKISKNGSNAKNLVEAAHKHGLDAYGFKIEPEELQKQTNFFPCIIHWNFNHFVVLNGFKHNKVFLNDPAEGKITINLKQFSNCFTGICLIFKPNKNFKVNNKPKPILKFTAKTIKNTITVFCLIFIINLINFIINLIKPGFLRFLIDKILNSQNFNFVAPFIFIFTTITITELIIIWFQTVNFLKIKGAIASKNNYKFMWHLLHLPLKFFHYRFTGEIQFRQQFNSSITNQIFETSIPTALNCISIIIILIIMSRYSFNLTLIISSTILISSIFSKIISNKQINISKIQLKNEGQFNATTIAHLNMIETIKASGQEANFFKIWANNQAKLHNQNFKHHQLNQTLAFIPSLLTELSLKFTIILGAWLIMNQKFTLGMILTFNMLTKLINKPLNSLISTNQQVHFLKTKIERVNDVLNQQKENIFKNNNLIKHKKIKKLSGKIEIKNLNFMYNSDTTPIFTNFNFKINPGEKVAITGPTGSGKSTLIKLINCLLTPQHGEILFDDTPANQIEKNHFKKSITTLNSQPFFFKDSIKNNLK